jgi:hypothetical protein
VANNAEIEAELVNESWRNSGSSCRFSHRETCSGRRGCVERNALAHSLPLSSRFLRGLFFIMLALSAFMSLIYTLPFSPSSPSPYSAF